MTDSILHCQCQIQYGAHFKGNGSPKCWNNTSSVEKVASMDIQKPIWSTDISSPTDQITFMNSIISNFIKWESIKVCQDVLYKCGNIVVFNENNSQCLIKSDREKKCVKYLFQKCFNFWQAIVLNVKSRMPPSCLHCWAAVSIYLSIKWHTAFIFWNSIQLDIQGNGCLIHPMICSAHPDWFPALVMFWEHSSGLFHEAGFNGVHCQNESVTPN